MSLSIRISKLDIGSKVPPVIDSEGNILYQANELQLKLYAEVNNDGDPMASPAAIIVWKKNNTITIGNSTVSPVLLATGSNEFFFEGTIGMYPADQFMTFEAELLLMTQNGKGYEVHIMTRQPWTVGRSDDSPQTMINTTPGFNPVDHIPMTAYVPDGE